MTHDEHSSDDTPPRRVYRSLFIKVLVLGFVMLVLAGIGSGLAAFMAYDYITRPGVAGAPVRVTIPEGSSGSEIGNVLTKAGLIDHPLFFRVAVRLSRSQKGLHYGDYDIPRGLSPLQIVELLQEGSNIGLTAEEIPDERRVTMPEGLTASQMAELRPDPKAFLDATSDPELIAKTKLTTATLDGFLLPETYFFDKKPTEREVVERLSESFWKEYNDLAAAIPGAADRDPVEVVTVASLIEEEARADGERPLIAAVIYNRLKANMPLGLDSTLQYALNKYGQRMLDRDKEVDSPYNTYKHSGLPPGPICNPGKACLRAAMLPEDVDYLYFVSNADGKTHTFSRTLAEHNKAVGVFRQEIAVQRKTEAREEKNAVP